MSQNENTSVLKLSLKSKMTFIVSLLVGGVLSLSAFIATTYFSKHFRQTVSSQQYVMVSTLADEIDSKILISHAELVHVAETITSDIIADPAKAAKFFDNRPDTRAIFSSGLFLISPLGKIITGPPMDMSRHGNDCSIHDCLRKTLASGKPEISEPFFFFQLKEQTKRPVVMFSAPIFNGNGVLIAVLAGSIDLLQDNFLGKLATTKLGQSGYLYLYNTSRTIIMHPDRTRILRQDVPKGANRLFDKAIEGFEGTGETVTSRGLHTLSSFKRLKTTNWILAANYPVREAFAPIAMARNFLLMVLLLTVIFSILVVWLSMSYLTAPLLLLTNHAGDIANGKAVARRLEIPTGDEIDTLARAFNNMVEELDGEKSTAQNQAHFLQTLINSLPYPVFYKDVEGKYIGCNKSFEEYVEIPREQLLGKSVFDIAPPEQAEIYYQADKELLLRQGQQSYEAPVKYADGTLHDVVFFKATFNNVDGTLGGLIGSLLDITDRKNLEAQLRHSQKMESVGTLAGGVAHDFNNILTAIIGYGYLALRRMSQEDPQRRTIEHILEASDRAAHLTKDLLLFSRKQPIDRKPIDLGVVVAKVEKFLQRVIGEDIECKTVLQEVKLPVLADAYQLEQVLVNLATNARDAMPQGGTLTVSTENILLEEEFVSAHGFGKPGTYALITVSDTGMGLDEDMQKRIFEPFFTTKEVGKGTGLGLAVVYGIIKQHDGYITVYSEPGAGTTFRIYLPISAAESGEEAHALQEVSSIGGTETILLAEDDKAVRDLTRTLLMEFGYFVIEAVDGEDAVQRFMMDKDAIDLLLFDLIMPKMNGKEAYDAIKLIRPEMKVIFSSGYAPDILRQKAALADGAHLITKPAPPAELLRKVRMVLDGKD